MAPSGPKEASILRRAPLQACPTEGFSGSVDRAAEHRYARILCKAVPLSSILALSLHQNGNPDWLDQ
jgi:hypothetical protein